MSDQGRSLSLNEKLQRFREANKERYQASLDDQGVSDADDIWTAAPPTTDTTTLGLGSETQKEEEPIPSTTDQPISSSNIGYKLLKNMGWNGSEGLGKRKNGMTAPIQVTQKSDKMGLGQQAVVDKWTSADNVKRKLLLVERDETEEERAQRAAKAKQLETIKQGITKNNRPFYCDVCDKQYKRASEYEVHLSSYSHNHVVREKSAQKLAPVKSNEEVNRAKKKREEKEEREWKQQIEAAKQAEAQAASKSAGATAATPASGKVAFSMSVPSAAKSINKKRRPGGNISFSLNMNKKA